jgi:methylenetetrahydrofolate reductase (NADPH)
LVNQPVLRGDPDMKPVSKLAGMLAGNAFILTAEYLPVSGTETSAVEAAAKSFGSRLTAVNAADNHFGVALSSLAASVGLSKAGIEPVYQMVTRDRNRIALQSDLLGTAFLGIKNVLCLSGYHQAVIDCPQAANVYDIDSIQLIALVQKMNGGLLLDGVKIQGEFAMTIGAAANPNLKPLGLNIMRLGKKVTAGASFIQTQAVFDVPAFKLWLEAAAKAGIANKTAILAGVMPLQSAEQAQKLVESHTDYIIPAGIIDRLKAAGDASAQKKEGVKIAVEMIKSLKGTPGLRGIHILSGGNEAVVPELLATI